jgi:hypothetical protein
MITNDIQDIKNENQAVVKAIDKNKEILSSREGSRIIALFALLNNYYQPTITTTEYFRRIRNSLQRTRYNFFKHISN